MNLVTTTVLNVIADGFVCLVDGKRYEYYSYKDFQNSNFGKGYIVVSMKSENGKICVGLEKFQYQMTVYSDDEEWVTKYKKDFGTEPGFF